MSGPRRSCARRPPVISSGRRPAELIEAKRRIAYVGAEQQDKYARYGWNLRVRRFGCDRAAPHRSAAVAGHAGAGGAGGRDVARLRLVAAGMRANSCRCRMGRSVWRCWRARWCRSRIGCCWTSSTMDWTLHYRRRIDAVLGRRARRGQSWVATAHRAGDVPRGTRCLLELAQGAVVLDQDVSAPRTSRTSAEQAGETPAPRRGRAAARRRRRGRDGRGRAPPMLVRLSQVDLYVEYRPVLRDLDWQLRKGEHWAVYGANGAGKSSFLKLLYGDLSPALGRAHRALRISQGHADRGMETADRLRVARAAKRLRRGCQRAGSGRERPLCQHRSRG